MVRKVLTPLQQRVLVSLFDNGLGELGYYLTGGTALAEFYLQHRYSDDLDFFARTQQPPELEFRRFLSLIPSLGFMISSQSISGEHLRLLLQSEEKTEGSLKIEFARDVPARMAPPFLQDAIVVDSYEDIAVNKICAILNRQPPESKDFCDLYFILKESLYTLDYLLGRAREKEAWLDAEDGILAFAANLLAVKELKILPRMIKALSQEELEAYLVPLAVELAQRFRPGSDPST
ncbi:MAG: nucleotidyl transferase AbiEii/AbiGii toxin family protein [Nitrospiraceae bacterium]